MLSLNVLTRKKKNNLNDNMHVQKKIIKLVVGTIYIVFPK